MIKYSNSKLNRKLSFYEHEFINNTHKYLKYRQETLEKCL